MGEIWNEQEHHGHGEIGQTIDARGYATRTWIPSLEAWRPSFGPLVPIPPDEDVMREYRVEI